MCADCNDLRSSWRGWDMTADYTSLMVRAQPTDSAMFSWLGQLSDATLIYRYITVLQLPAWDYVADSSSHS